MRCREKSGDGRALKTGPVAAQALHSLHEELLALRGHSRDVVLLPLNGSIYVLEDLLHRVGNLVTNTISGNEGDLVVCLSNHVVLHAGRERTV